MQSLNPDVLNLSAAIRRNPVKHGHNIIRHQAFQLDGRAVFLNHRALQNIHFLDTVTVLLFIGVDL